MKRLVFLQTLLMAGLSTSASALEPGGIHPSFFGVSPSVPSAPVFSFATIEPRFSLLERATSPAPPWSLEQDETRSTHKDGEAPFADTIVAPGFRDFGRALAYNFTKGLFSRENLKPLLIGSAATLVVVPFDDAISERVQGSASDLGDIGDVVGRPLVVGAATGVLLLATPFIDNQRYRAFTFSLGQAFILNFALTEGIKAAVSRTRPNGEDDYSFPSGHTSSTFAWASVLAHYYGKAVGIPSYIVATLIAVSRIERGSHFPSDVVFGATLGLISGFTAVRGSKHFGERRRFALLPSAGPNHVGVYFHLQF
ncbi:MAG: phosphatase PAP2 family protein [Acidobacteria bacterium]|nr:MAG: phosphatase PAP2 family protein [Acidobacteriota bacterium]